MLEENAVAEKIYLADTDKSVLEAISSHLIKDGFEVEGFANGDAMLAACEKALPDLALLDVVLPGTDGLSVCSALRRSYPQLPIILISVNDNPYDRVTGLTIGADDYLSKPFLPIELIARIRALLRRARSTVEEEKEESALTFGSLALNIEKRTATLFGENFPLTPNEFDFLAFLIERDGSAVSREELINRLWKAHWQEDTRVADDLVKRLRKKMRLRNSDVAIKTVWGYGFRLAVG